MSKRIEKFWDIIRSCDGFYTNVQFTFDKGKTEFQSKSGGIMSILMAILVFGYGLMKGLEMINHHDPDIQTYVDYQAYNNTYEFGHDEQFRFAFRMTKPLDADYGNLIVT